MNQAKPSLDSVYKVAVIMTLAMISSIFIFGMMSYVMLQSEKSSMPEIITGSSNAKYAFMKVVLFLVSIFEIISVFIMKKIMLGPLRLGAPGKGLEPHEKIKKLFSFHIVAGALSQGPALFGFILALMTQEFSSFILLAVISLISFAIFFPRKSEWKHLLTI